MKNYYFTILILLSITTILLFAHLLILNFNWFQYKEKPLDNILNNPYYIKAYVANLIYNVIEPSLTKVNGAIKYKLNRYTLKGKPHIKPYYIEKNNNYCRANFLSTFLNSETIKMDDNKLYIDLNNNKIVKILSKNFDFVNKAITSKVNISETEYLKLKNSKWNPKMNLFYGTYDLTYFEDLGKSQACLFQMINSIPGIGFMYRTDLLIDRIRLISLEKKEDCSFITKTIPTSYRLYIKDECINFFNTLKTKKFRDKMKTKNIYILINMDYRIENKLDYLEIQNLNKVYAKGKNCGFVDDKTIAQKYISSYPRYINGAGFKLRTYINVACTDPLSVYFNMGHAILNRNNKSKIFNNNYVSIRKLFRYLKKKKVLNEMDIKTIKQKIKSFILFNIHSIKKDIIRDRRLYQIVAFDFIINSKNSIKFIGGKSNPYFTTKNMHILNSFLKQQSKIIDYNKFGFTKLFKEAEYNINFKMSKNNININQPYNIKDYISKFKELKDLNEVFDKSYSSKSEFDFKSISNKSSKIFYLEKNSDIMNESDLKLSYCIS